MPPFWSQNRLIPCLLTTSHLSGGDLFITSLGTKDKRPAAIFRSARRFQTASLVVNTGNPGFPEPWLSEIRRRTGKHPRTFLISSVFLFFRPRILENYPRRSSAFFWTGLELRGPKFDQFRPTFPFFSSFLVPKSMIIQLFPFIFKRTGPETMLRT